MDQTNNPDSPIGSDALVLLLPCPFCGSEAEITDESQPKRPKSWFFAWCKNRDGCNSWLADKSPENVAKKWNTRAVTAMEEQFQHDLKLAARALRDQERETRTRLLKVCADLEESAQSHRKHRDAATDEVTKMCHAGAWDAFLAARSLVSAAIWASPQNV